MNEAAALTGFPDPRVFRAAQDAPQPAARWYALAAAALDAATAAIAIERDGELRSALTDALAADAGPLAAAIAGAPSPAIARHLWRALDRISSAPPDPGEPDLGVTLFALPLVIIAGIADGGEAVLPGVLDDVHVVAEILRAGRQLGGNQTFALGNALVAANTLDIGRLKDLQALQVLPSPGAAVMSGQASSFLAPAPMRVTAGSESAHLRFLVGTALAAPGVDLLADGTVGSWGAPLTRELIRQISARGVSVLPLPRAPARPLPAHYQGLAAQREISAQLFATNAIRKFRASVGEPSAVIAAHRSPSAPGGGELRLSLSSPFEPRDAEGFRCPVYGIERVADVVAMIKDLLRDCRVTDVRLLAGVHPDRAPGSSMPLLFKPETIPGFDAALLQ